MSPQPTLDTAQLDRIVREVVRRLAAMPVAESGSALQQQPSPQRPQPEASQPRGPASQTLVMRDKVVTLAALDGQLAQVRRLEVSPSAIVTPAVQDELRRRGVALARQRAPHDSAAQTQLLVAACRTPRGPVLQQVLAPLGASSEDYDCWRQATDQACQWLEHGGQRSVIWTEWPAAVVCRANRRAHVRAACGWDLPATREAIEQLDVNLLVIDARRHQPYELKAILQTFVDRSRGNLPPVVPL